MVETWGREGKVGETSPPRRLPVEVVGCDGRAFVAGGSIESSALLRSTPPSSMSASGTVGGTMTPGGTSSSGRAELTGPSRRATETEGPGNPERSLRRWNHRVIRRKPRRSRFSRRTLVWIEGIHERISITRWHLIIRNGNRRRFVAIWRQYRVA